MPRDRARDHRAGRRWQEQAVFCDRYAPDKNRPFDASFEDGYQPLTQAEVDELDALTDEEVEAEIEEYVNSVADKAEVIYQRTLTVAQVAGLEDPIRSK